MLNSPAYPSIVEPTPIFDVYCSRLSWVEQTGPNVRFIFTTECTVPECGAGVVNQVAARVILPMSATLPGVELMVARLGLAVGARILKAVR